eukprot:Skav221404  [mRNA]  locus=scaffold1621:29576:31408:- [translate_table: standard]
MVKRESTGISGNIQDLCASFGREVTAQFFGMARGEFSQLTLSARAMAESGYPEAKADESQSPAPPMDSDPCHEEKEEEVLQTVQEALVRWLAENKRLDDYRLVEREIRGFQLKSATLRWADRRGGPGEASGDCPRRDPWLCFTETQALAEAKFGPWRAPKMD